MSQKAEINESSIQEFPALLNGEAQPSMAAQAQVNIECPSSELLRDSTWKDDIPLQAIVQTVWTVILKTFTGDSTIRAASLAKTHGANLQCGLIETSVEDEATLIELVGSIQNSTRNIELGQIESLPCNSCVCVVETTDEIDCKLDQFDMSLHVMADGPRLQMSLFYNTGHVAPSYATIVAATISQILGEIIANPSQKLSDINLLHPQVWHQLQSWSSIPSASIDYCVGAMFEKTVRERPFHIAVHTSEVALNYQELNTLSAQLAHHLKAKGVRPESIVVLCFPKSAWAVVAMMAVIRAGGAILFLDPSHPPARHREIVDQVRAELILTAPEYTPLWGWFEGSVLPIHRGSVDSLLQPEPAAGPIGGERVPSTVKPSNALYVIFTSGSTGKPKGCVVEHRQFLAGSLAQRKASRMSHKDRVLQLASFTFDVCILEIITSLISGACVCMPNDEERSKGPASCIQQFGVTWAFLTPSLVKLVTPEMVPTLRFLALGGEAVHRENIQTWASHLRLANGYGPTECSIAATLNPQLSLQTSPANIGYPLGGCCWIVSKDSHERLMPIGAPGELVIQGPIVARGYLNEPEKTKEVFLESTTWSPAEPSGLSRLYKTGDLARFNADGSLHFIGRKDSQVKLRGLRIELGEIEHRLVAHPLVEQAAVALANRGPGHGKLCAVVSLRKFQQTSPTVELVATKDMESAMVELKAVAEALSEQLPSYMQPTLWAPVRSIPLTIAGKQNGMMVQHWVADMPLKIFHLLTGRSESAEVERIPASTDQERELQALCSTILGAPHPEHVWLNRSFIQNGGDSIQAMQLLDQLRRKGAGAMKLEDILQSATLVDMAQRMAEHEPIEAQCDNDGDDAPAAAWDEERISQLGLRTDDVEDLYPISAVQRGILLAQQQDPDRYQLRITCEVLPPPGEPVRRERLQRAWQQVADRHPALRTVFVEAEAEDGLCDQVVLRRSHIAVVEWSHDDENAFWEQLGLYTRVDQPLQPPVTFIVSSIKEGKTFCTFDISHALIDGVSILILLRDISQAYGGLLVDPRQTVKYAPYIHYLQRLQVNTSLKYWTEYLADVPPCHFPVVNDDITDDNKLHELAVDMENADAIHAFCAAHNVTPATVFQAAWALVLKTYTGQDDVCFGYLTAGRDLPVPNISDAVGVFINMMIYRMRLSSDHTVATLIKETQDGFLKGLSHQHCSIAEIQHALGTGQALFNTILSLQSSLGEEISGGDPDRTIRFQVVGEHDPTEVFVSLLIIPGFRSLPTNDAQYNVSVNVFVSKVRVSLTLRYFTATLSDAMGANVVATFRTAVHTLIHSHNSSLSNLEFLSERDHHQIASWNRDPWQEMSACVHDVVHRQALVRPGARAIDAWDGGFTYEELDHTATSLSLILKENGVGPETLVPLCFSKSCWTVVAQLATLKAGGACVAFDPEHPSNRREEMLRQCDATVALVAEGYESLFQGLVRTVLVIGPRCVDDLRADPRATMDYSTVSPVHPAFVVFTSGSTGKPKGIVLEHRAICSSAQAHGPAMNYGPDARVLQFASYTFDVSIGETFTCLMSGGTLCIPNEEERLNDLAGVINRMNTTVVYLTPSVVSLLDPSQVPGVGTLALGGEAVREENILAWADNTHLVNIYGPAECSVWSTGLQGVPRSASPRNIGHGLGARMWITQADDPSRLCAVGAVGELLIEGPIVARGYLKDDAKTAAVFIPPPAWLAEFDSDAAQGPIRLYRTGDLARYDSDGSVHFIGRRDHQVKLHGQRVEMGEIDHALVCHEAVQNALALVPKDGPLKGKLVAVVALKNPCVPSSAPDTSSRVEFLEHGNSEDTQRDLSDIRQRVSSLLPAYMVPSTWLVVRSIPMTRNGKSDRPTVTAWVETLKEDSLGVRLDPHETSRAANQMETDLQQVISRVLNIPVTKVSMDQSFLALGGDSITAMQVASRSRSRGLGVAVKTILKSKTLRQIASQATMDATGLPSTPSNGSTTLQPFALLPTTDRADLEALAQELGYMGVADLEDAYPCSPMQEGILISQSQAPETYKFHAVCAIRAKDHADHVVLDSVRRAWQCLVARHPALRTFFVEGLSQEGLYSQLVLKEYTPRIETVKDLDSLHRYPYEHPVDYHAPVPPHRLALFENDDGVVYFNLEISHTVIDGASMAVILRDLAAAYGAELPPRPVYRDYIALLQRQSTEATLRFWTQYLEGAKPVVFPSLCDHPEPTKELRVVNIPIAQATFSRLQSFTKHHEVTLANIFQAVWAVVLRAYTGESDVVFGYLSSGRDTEGLDSDVEHAVGVFISMLACRAEVDDDATLLGITRRMHDDFLNSLPHQRTSLAQVQHALQLSGERLFNTILSLQRPMVESNTNDAITIEYLSGSDPTEYDLGVNITVSEDAVDVSINYWSTGLSDNQADLLASTLSTTLATLLATPTKPLREVDMLGQQHMRYINSLNNHGTVPETTYDCIHSLVHHRATQHPDAAAIDAWDASLSYAELDQLSAQLATHLVVLGVEVEDAVPLCFEKSAWAVVSMLAVLKAGAAYVSMNPSHPTPHLANIIHQTKARVVLAGSHADARKVRPLVDRIVVVDPALFPTLRKQDPAALAPRASPDNAAMINFTSGSTGKPKGIVVLHKGVCSLVAHNPDLGIDHASRVLQFSAYTFDTSNSEIFITLCRGGCVCVPSDHDRLNDLAGAMNRLRVTTAFLTPSVALFLSPEEVPTLRTLGLIGEVVTNNLARKWQDQVRLVNSYGPAECTVKASFSVLREGIAAANIGHGHGCLLWVVEPDNSDRLVPVGCTGELLIEGPLVSRGYLDPEQTARAFIPPPRWRTGAVPTTRLYKTGDLVKSMPDGSLVYIGRKDSQIKLNGQRVEMGEVEKSIQSDALVQQCVVLLPTRGPCKKKLVAVVVLAAVVLDHHSTGVDMCPLSDAGDREKAVTEIATIRDRLATTLPNYMIPSVWLVCPNLPWTASRKVDRPMVSRWVDSLDNDTYRRAVVEEEADAVGDRPADSASGSEMEERLRDVVARVLNIPRDDHLSRGRSFLNLGGDSITAMQLVVLCRNEGIHILFKDVMRSSSITALAQGAESVVDRRASHQATEQWDTPFGLTPIQQLYFEEISQGRTDLSANRFNQSFLLRLTRPRSIEQLRSATDQIVQRHSMLRARYRSSHRGAWTQMIPSQTRGSYRFREHAIASEEDAFGLALRAQEELDIQNGPVFAVDVFTMAGRPSLVFLVAHHLVIDLVSWRILFQELEDSLAANASPPGLVPFSFQRWQQLQADYATRHLPPSLALPYAIPPANYDYWGMTNVPNKHEETVQRAVALTRQETELLLTHCHASMRTEPLDVLIAALLLSFAQTFGREPPAVFNEGHGRQPAVTGPLAEIDLSDSVGWFTTIFPFHVPVHPHQTAVELVRRVKDQRKELPANGWSYFASKYLHEEGVRAFANHMPMEILFNYLGLYQGLERADGLFQRVPFHEGDVGPGVRRYTLFEINVYVIHGCAQVTFAFHRKMKHQQRIDDWIGNYTKMLKEFSEQLASADVVLTRSDYPLLPISYPRLDELSTQRLPELGYAMEDIEDLYPCSPLQEGILLSQTRMEETYRYHAIMRLDSIRGEPAEAQRLLSAWQQVVDRHSILRTVFLARLSSRPFDQMVLRKHEAQCLRLENAHSDEDALAALRRLNPLPVSASQPPHRMAVIQSPDGALYFKLDISHALMDGTAMTLLIHDLMTAYTHQLPSTPATSYSEYIAYIQSLPAEEAIEFWATHLGDVKPCHVPALLESSIPSTVPETRHVDVSVPNAAQVRRFCKQNDVTLANVVRLAWALVLSAYTGTEHVCFGYLTAGREIPVPGIESAVGPFINMLVCAMDIAEMRRKPVLGALRGLQEEYLKTLSYQHVGLAEIQHRLGVAGQSLFNTVVSFQRRDVEDLVLDGLRLGYIEGEDPTEYDITVNITHTDRVFTVQLGYLTSRLSPQHAEHVSEALSAALSSIVSNPRSSVESVDLFGPQQSKQVGIWNASSPATVQECLHTLFERRARAAAADTPAIASWDVDLTYAQLDKKATQLARVLVNMGLGPEDLIPICFDKSSWAIVAMLGILKAGAGFVPLDPAHPPERLAAIVAQSAAQLVLVAMGTAKLVTDLVPQILVISASSNMWLGKSCDGLIHDRAPSPTNVAYTLFTSGSTGTPKGVVMEHAAACTSVIHHGREIGCSAATRMFQFAAFTFDACILEIFTTLAYGGCICIPSEAERMSDIAGSIQRLQVNTSFLTPSVIRILRPEQVPGLTTLILGGEALDPDNIRTWAGHLRLMNGYGPTETCVFCVMNTFASPTDRNVLGRAVSSLSWIVRPGNHQQLAPIGSVGELLVQGGTLARGYLHDEAKTAEVFVTDPAFFSPKTDRGQSRFYKTGDLVRYNPDGTITYLGRKDTQIKLRGQRIELAEIEHQIQRHLPSNSHVAVEVVLPHGEKEQALLAAFICPPNRVGAGDFLAEITPEVRSQLGHLKTSLTGVLPLYMQPSLYLPTNWMPTTSAKKMDRQFLRQCGASLSDPALKTYSLLEDRRRVPSTVLEKKVQEVWHRVLKVPRDQIRADDDFFQVGGDSIAAMKIAAVTSDDMLIITVADIFRHPVLSDLAGALAARNPQVVHERSVSAFELLPNPLERSTLLDEVGARYRIPSHSIEDIYPSTPLQQGMMALSLRDPGAYVFRRILRLGPSIDIDRFQSAWEMVFQRNPILRTRLIQTTDAGLLLQVVVTEGIEWRTAETLHQYLESDSQEGITYGAPLSRYAITADGHFIWTAHHSLYDGWSLPRVLDQVKSAYNYGSCPNPPGFNAFIKYLRDTDVHSTRTFWAAQLAGQRPSTFPELPSSSYRPSVRGATRHTIPFPPSTGAPVLKATILRAAWALLLSLYTDSEDVVFGMTLSGRNSPVPGIDQMVGPMITTVPVRVRFPAELTVGGFLHQIHEQATDMIPHEHFGLQNIAGVSAECARAIEFQNLFVIQPPSDVIPGDDLLPGCEEVELPLQGFDSYPLVVECYPRETEVHLEARHDESVLSVWQVQNMMSQLEHLVQQLLPRTGNEGLRIAEIDLFMQKDRQQVLQWNQTYPEVVESTVPEIFNQQVSDRPGALAVDAWDGQLTYAELDSLSTTLARHLRYLRVRPEVFVPLCFDKSRWAVVAQMAVLKAGGACVNLDPAHPQARLESIVRDAQAPVLLCAPRHEGILGSSAHIQEVKVTEDFIDSLVSSPEVMDLSPHDLSPRNAAYVLFTSGSTGKPKGIVIEHGSLCSSSKAHGTRWGIGPETRLLQFAAYTFDVSCADIFTTLQRGGCICVPSEHDRLNALSDAINRFQCNWAFLTPTVASLLPADDIPSLKTLVLGGEASTWDTVRKWHSVLDLIVCYGPAECSVYCSGAPPATATSDPANLGAAIGALYWVADPQDPNRLMPIGCVGELLLEGPTVARGYLHDAEKTAGAFLQSLPWAPPPSGDIHRRPRVFYRTGDLVRYNEDGTIRFVGRKDTQVKVRGQRVELGEIEHAIRRSMPTLAHATVDAVRDPALQRQVVVAFLHFSHRSGRAEVMDMIPELHDQLIHLQQTLSQCLPSYMIPSMFLPLARVPLTMNGKADRRQLRELVLSLSPGETLTYSLADGCVKQEPSTAVEFQLRDLWAKVLHVDADQIGTGDHFFRSGGDSIIAMKLTSLARARGWHLSVQTIFQVPILSDMATQVEAQFPEIQGSHFSYQPFSLLPPNVGANSLAQIARDIKTTPDNIADVLPVTDFQALAIAHSMLKSRGLLNYLFLDGQGPLPWTAEFVQDAWTRFLQAHQILRTVFTAQDDRFYQVVLMQVTPDIEWYETDRDINSLGAELCEKDVASDDLQLGDPLSKLIVVGNQKHHRLIIRMSHGQYDGVCLPQIWQSLRDVFAGQRPVPDVPFAHYVAAIDARHHGRESVNYWQGLLANSTMTNIAAHSKPDYRNIYDVHLTRTIPIQSHSVSGSGITFATILKTAWATVLSALSHTTDVVFGHVVSGRNVPGPAIERIVGPCLNIVPVRVSIDSTTTVADLLHQVQSQHITSMAHDSMGMREVVRRCSPWAPFTRFSSIVQHQNIEQLSAVSLDGRPYTVGDFCPAADEADLAIKTTPLDENQMQVLLLTSSQSVGESTASTLLDLLCDTIQAICDPDSATGPVFRVNGHEHTMTTATALIPHQEGAMDKLASAIYGLWRRVLQEPDLPLGWESDFFAVGGDLISAALLAAIWRQEGYPIAVEDLLDRSSVRGMAEALLQTQER
ncbi:hypothetical protein EYZ11_002112 [Aspergillus tanneri]|uniref:Carrier domain-containing protein n=1 Tax=Aspergillus tanneri TaxID=1220188 RepID=A0A4S3JRH3_9EURO|nr:hypothetical protein EYZ11_002112 [Aspergillus tanneri]